MRVAGARVREGSLEWVTGRGDELASGAVIPAWEERTPAGRVDDPRWGPEAVLPADETDPDWVPLMAEAVALVTAKGRMLCHAAIVARELGIPCVTGVGVTALRRLTSGGLLAVDGTAGTVSVLNQAT